jgi:UDP-N-acetylglucosamine 2-epimerase
MPRGDLAPVVGTRRDIIRLVGLIEALVSRTDVVNTGQQHRISKRVLTFVE